MEPGAGDVEEQFDEKESKPPSSQVASCLADMWFASDCCYLK